MKEKPKRWECVGPVRRKKQQSRGSDAAGERAGASGQDVSEEKQIASFVPPSGHRPGLMSDLGGVAGWLLSQSRQGAAAVRTKEAARVALAEATPVQANYKTAVALPPNLASTPRPRSSDVAPGPYPPFP